MTVRQEDVEFLQHYGVKGMRWGVRKKSKVSGSTQHRVSGDARKAYELRSKPRSSLSNKQLKALNERIQLEQRHAQLNPTKVAKGKKHVTEALGTIGLAVSIYNLANSPAGKAAIGTAKKFLSGPPKAGGVNLIV